MDKPIANFLKEYKQLCLKYNLVIDACGCCDSPWVSIGEEYIPIEFNSKMTWEEKVNKNIEWLKRK